MAKKQKKEKIYVTREGLGKLREEYNILTELRRKEISERIQTARELGDITENAEYAAALEEQASVEGRIAELEAILKSAAVIENEKDKEKAGVVSVGSTVIVEIEGEEDTYQIVGSVEAEPEQSMISNESPVGKALIGARAGDDVEVVTPMAKLVYKIKEIK